MPFPRSDVAGIGERCSKAVTLALPWQGQCIAETAVWEMGFEMAERTLGRFARGDMQTALNDGAQNANADADVQLRAGARSGREADLRDRSV
jgi:hypothetical protein